MKKGTKGLIKNTARFLRRHYSFLSLPKNFTSDMTRTVFPYGEMIVCYFHNLVNSPAIRQNFSSIW